MGRLPSVCFFGWLWRGALPAVPAGRSCGAIRTDRAPGDSSGGIAGATGERSRRERGLSLGIQVGFRVALVRPRPASPERRARLVRGAQWVRTRLAAAAPGLPAFHQRILFWRDAALAWRKVCSLFGIWETAAAPTNPPSPREKSMYAKQQGDRLHFLVYTGYDLAGKRCRVKLVASMPLDTFEVP